MNKKKGRLGMVKKGTFGRIIKTLFEFYPVMMPVVLICILFSAIVSSIPSIFMQQVVALISDTYKSGDWEGVSGQIVHLVSILGTFYVLSIVANIAYNQMMAIITQGTLKKLRAKMFNGMQYLPIKYFDQNNHGDIMSYYTNDIDTLRQMISQSIPNLINAVVVVCTPFFLMVYFSLWMALVVVVGVIVMIIITKKCGGASAKYFIRQQQAVGKMEGYIEEIMNGEKVVKVFCHEEETEEQFNQLNEELFKDAEAANQFSNMLMPILNNVGNILYVIVAAVGGLLIYYNVPNVGLSGIAMGVSIVVPF